MDAGTKSPPTPEQDRPDGLTGAPEGLDQAARGVPIGEDAEHDVLSFLLGKTHRPEADVKVEFETPEGLLPMTFRIRALDERTMDKIDAANRAGDGPFSKLDRGGFNAGVIAEALVHVEAGGRTVKPDSEEFRGSAVNTQVAIEGRFRYQPGILEQVVEEVRKLSAYNPERVGTAQRVVKAAAGNSSSAGAS